MNIALLLLALPITLFCVAGIRAETDARRAEFHYQLYCQGCHTPDGTGGRGVPRMKDTVGHFLKTDEGRAYLMQVPGASSSVLSNSQLAEVMNWLIERFAGESAPPNWKPYTEQETARYRKTPIWEASNLRASLLGRAVKTSGGGQ